MNITKIFELVERLKIIEETLVYWKTPSFTSSIESNIYNINRLEQEKEQIKFQLEFPYLLFNLLTEVEEKEGAKIRVEKRQKDTCAISVNYKNYYNFTRLDEPTKESYEELANFLEECKERKLCKDIEIALDKLTDKEKKLLRLDYDINTYL